METTRVLMVASGLLLCMPPLPAPGAEPYPSRPVKVIVTGSAGSGPDVLARTVAQQLEQRWKEPVLVVNQPGAGGLIAAQTAASAEKDGHTLYVPTITTFVILPEMHDKLPIDLDRDFAPIGLVAQTPMMIAVAPSLGVGSLAELVAQARRSPGQLFYAANNRGSLPHLAAELWRYRADAPMTFVPYQGFAAGLQDLMGGRLSMIVESVGAMSGAIKAGTVKPLAVASSSRLPEHPNLPTVSESIPGFTAVAWVALAAPAGTPLDVINRVNEDLNAALVDPALLRRFNELGAVPGRLTPAQTRDFIRAEQQVWRPVVRQVGLRSQ